MISAQSEMLSEAELERLEHLGLDGCAVMGGWGEAGASNGLDGGLIEGMEPAGAGEGDIGGLS